MSKESLYERLMWFITSLMPARKRVNGKGEIFYYKKFFNYAISGNTIKENKKKKKETL